jgi:hypothetical protein
MDQLKSLLVRVWRLFHPHRWGYRYLDMPQAIWPFRAPYLEVCICGATRLRETRAND